MTYIEYRAQMTALTQTHSDERRELTDEFRYRQHALKAKHRSERQALTDQYTSQDRTAINAAKAAKAREARKRYAVERAARRFIPQLEKSLKSRSAITDEPLHKPGSMLWQYSEYGDCAREVFQKVCELDPRFELSTVGIHLRRLRHEAP